MANEWVNVDMLPDRTRMARMASWHRQDNSVSLRLHYILIPQWAGSADVYWSDARRAFAIVFRRGVTGAFRLRPNSHDSLRLVMTRAFKRVPAAMPPQGVSDAAFSHTVIGDNRALIVEVPREDSNA